LPAKDLVVPAQIAEMHPGLNCGFCQENVVPVGDCRDCAGVPRQYTMNLIAIVDVQWDGMHFRGADPFRDLLRTSEVDIGKRYVLDPRGTCEIVGNRAPHHTGTDHKESHGKGKDQIIV
jgi:hypothetical protein